jgi:hypothetical protein
MEPQYMIAGHAAGVAAAMAAKGDAGLRRIDVRRLQEKLQSQKQVVHMVR